MRGEFKLPPMKAEHKVAMATAAVLSMLGAGSLLALPSKPKSEAAHAVAASDEIIIPVSGVSTDKLSDTWGSPRAGGRAHQGIDIFAAQGTPVKATAAGKIAKLYLSKRGGITIYQTSEDGAFVFYYAHLNGYAPNLKVGLPVAQGQVIGYVGQTGNAPVPHLHFEIQAASAGRQWWKGVAMNPYPLLKAGKVEVAAVPAPVSLAGAVP